MNIILCLIFGILFGMSFFVVYRLGVIDGKKESKSNALVINDKNKKLLEEYQKLWSFNGEE